jgi:hypothetical protein
MTRCEQWRTILDAEMKRWEAKSCEQLIFELTSHIVTYERKLNSKKCQFEVQLVEDTETYVHVLIAVDEARLWGAMHPWSSSFIRK